jgi:hypothetical protein
MLGSGPNAFADQCAPSRDADLLTPDRIRCDPPLARRVYIDHFGNRVTRVEVPAGLVAFSNRFVIHDSGKPDETPPDVDMTPIADLPDDVLLFLLQSRYCDSDKLADFAWSNFGMILGGRQRVQAVCSCTRRSASVILMRAPPAARAIPCMKALVYAATSRISPWRSAGAWTFPRGIAPAISATSAFRLIPIPRISAPGLRPSWTDVGTRATQVGRAL